MTHTLHDALHYLRQLPHLQKWPEIQDLLTRASENAAQYWRLPIIGCTAVGRAAQQALPGVAAIACLHTSIILIDDMLDADPKGAHHRLGCAETTNMATALQAAGLAAITHSSAEPALQRAVMHSLNQMALTTALGQHWDVQNPADEESFWRIVRTKSAPFFGTALSVGAQLGGADAHEVAQIDRIGRLYGEMIQIQDDLKDAMETPAAPEWIAGRPSLPLLYATLVPHPERERFVVVRRAAADPAMLAEGQEILIRCGAVSYAVDQLLWRHKCALDIVQSLSLPQRAAIDNLLAAIMAPVHQLLALAAQPAGSVPRTEATAAFDPALLTDPAIGLDPRLLFDS